MDESKIEFNESVIVENEFRENFKANVLVQGLNLFGRCSNYDCRKKFVVKLGYGSFEIGKRLADMNNTTIIQD